METTERLAAIFVISGLLFLFLASRANMSRIDICIYCGNNNTDAR
jgi:hypothetical protein